MVCQFRFCQIRTYDPGIQARAKTVHASDHSAIVTGCAVQYVVLRNCEARNVDYTRNPREGPTRRACSQEIHPPPSPPLLPIGCQDSRQLNRRPMICIFQDCSSALKLRRENAVEWLTFDFSLVSL
jgi:hypothetical protein